MSPRLRRLGFYLWAVAVLGALGGCATTRNLKISEVSLNAIELYLDEDRANRLDLDGQKLGYIIRVGTRPSWICLEPFRAGGGS